MTCFDSQVIQRLTVFLLDECGRIPTNADDPTPALKGLADAILTVGRTRNVDVPANTASKVVSGKTCSKPRGTPTDNGFAYTLTFCGQNPLFEVATGYKTLDRAGDDIVGWEDVQVSRQTNLAMEIIFTPSSDACAPGETPQCQALLVPNLEQWVRAGDDTFNGEDIPDLAMTGQTALSKNLFANYANAAALPTYLSAWAPKFADIATGRSWSYTRLVDCPADDTESPCDFVAIETGS